MKKITKLMVTRVLIGLSLLLVISPVSFRSTQARDIVFKEVEEKSPLKGRYSSHAVAKIENSFHQIFNIYKKKVVFISTEKHVQSRPNPFANDPHFQKFFGPQFNRPRTKRQTGLGTGFFISKDGYVCTNYHVVKGVDSVRVRVGNQEFPARVIGTDPITDLALLKVDNGKNFEPAHFGDSNKVQVGDWAIAIGNPFGFDKTFTVGVVSAVRGNAGELGNSYIQTDASINQGNSGGPLLNLDGEVVGVNRMIYAKKGGGSLGIGFSIPINTAKKILEQLYHYGKVKWGYIGVKIANLNRKLAQQLGASNTRGALVVQPTPNGPAALAGLRRGDIILRVNNKRIKNGKHLIVTTSRMAVGTTASFEVLRNKKTIYLNVTITEKP